MLLMTAAFLATAGVGSVPAGDLFARGDFAAARVAYAAAATKNPHDVRALLGLARMELYANDLDAATRDADAAVAIKAANTVAKALLQTIAERRAVSISAGTLRIADSGVVIPFVESEPLPAIEISVNGKPATVVIDTGAPDVTLDPAFAQSAGIAVSAGSEGTFLGGRTAQIRQGVADRIDFGGMELRGVNVSILPSHGFRIFHDRTVDGVIGTTFLSRFLATLDYPNHRLALRPSGGQIARSSRAAIVPMWLVGDHFIFARGSVNALRNQLLSIDSGGAGAAFMPAALTIAAAHIKTFPEKAFKGMGGGGTVTVVPTMTARVCVGDVCQRDLPGGYTSESPLRMFPFAVAGTVSHAFLERYAITFDFVHMQMVWESPVYTLR